MVLDPSRRLQSRYVPVGDGVRLAVDVWLPVERIAAGEAIGAVVRTTRYHRADERSGSGPEDDANRAEGDLWNDAGFALVVADARGTGASFGDRSGELAEKEITDFGELIDWVAAQSWSNGRVGAYGSSYEGQAAELAARLRNPHLVAVGALFSPYDPYRQLFYPGSAATSGRFARWMCESQVKDGVIGARDRLAELQGLPAAELALPAPVKPVDGPDGPALLAEAVTEHQANTDVHDLMDRVPFRDDRVEGLDWSITAPASAQGRPPRPASRCWSGSAGSTAPSWPVRWIGSRPCPTIRPSRSGRGATVVAPRPTPCARVDASRVSSPHPRGRTVGWSAQLD